jgi:hypothetical protein
LKYGNQFFKEGDRSSVACFFWVIVKDSNGFLFRIGSSAGIMAEVWTLVVIIVFRPSDGVK